MKSLITRRHRAQTGGTAPIRPATYFVAALAALLAFTSCSSDKPEGEAGSVSMYQHGVPGGIRVETYKITATVTAIDPAKRAVTMVTPAGAKTTYKAGPEVVNFDQIHVGDQVKASVVQELVVYLRERGAPRTESQAAVVALAPEGGKPGLTMANTTEVIARVKSVDLKQHKVTLEFPDGSTRTTAVRPDIDLAKAKLGQEVVIQTTDAIAISVEKP